MENSARASKKIIWPHCVGQTRIKEILEAAVGNNSLGHAYLLVGPEGSGTFAAALDLALILLCESAEARPCMTCPSCSRVLHYAHPDFHVIMPVVLGKEHKAAEGELADEGWAHVAACVKERIAAPYSLPDHEKLPDIPVGWLREVNHTIKAGARGSGPNVAILDGVDSLKKESSNAMLKLLEEPPAGTVLLLLTDRIGAVLPTIVSRCQILRFAWLSTEEIRAELVRRFGKDTEGRNLDGLVHTGSMGKSLQLWNDPPDEMMADVTRFLGLCAEANWGEIASAIDRMAEWEEFSRYEQFFVLLMERLRNAFLHDLPGIEKVFLIDKAGAGRDGATLSYPQVEALLRVCERSIAAVKSRAISFWC